MTLDGDAETSPLGLLAGAVAAPGSTDGTVIERARNLRVESARVTLRSQQPGRRREFDDIELDMMAADGTFVGSIEGGGLSEMKMAGGSRWRPSVTLMRDIRLDVTADDFSAVGLERFIPGLPAMIVDAGKLSGNANLMFAAGDLVDANIDMVALDGGLDLTVAGLPVLDYDTASMIMEYQGQTGRLALAQGELALADGRTVSLSGT